MYLRKSKEISIIKTCVISVARVAVFHICLFSLLFCINQVVRFLVWIVFHLSFKGLYSILCSMGLHVVVVNAMTSGCSSLYHMFCGEELTHWQLYYTFFFLYFYCWPRKIAMRKNGIRFFIYGWFYGRKKLWYKNIELWLTIVLK